MSQIRSLSLLLIGLVILFRPFHSQATVTRDEWETIIEKLSGIYQDEIKTVTQRPLKVTKIWDPQSSVTMDSANQMPDGPTSEIMITGKLAKLEKISPDGLALMVCHEFGHHLGGNPRQSTKFSKWSSVEGQADYWATSNCMRKFMLDDDNKKIVSEGPPVPVEILSQCQKSFTGDEEKQFICQRSAMAALSLGDFFNHTTSKNRPIHFLTIEKGVTKTTLVKYGTDQCRLDTFLAGTFCPRDCPDGEEWGRPACWFRAAPLDAIEGPKKPISKISGESPKNISCNKE